MQNYHPRREVEVSRKCPLRPSLSIKKIRFFFEKKKPWWRRQGEGPARMIFKIFNNFYRMKLTTRVDSSRYPSITVLLIF